MKEGARVLGIDDAAFEFGESRTLLTGVVYRGTEFVEDIRTLEVDVDGNDSTEKVIRLHEKCNNPGQIKSVLLDGISFGGFNVLDIEKISNELEKPVISVTSNEPDREEFMETLNEHSDTEVNVESLDSPRQLEMDEGTVYFQFKGTSAEEARDIIRTSTTHGLTPEAVRVAHMIGRTRTRSV